MLLGLPLVAQEAPPAHQRIAKEVEGLLAARDASKIGVAIHAIDAPPVTRPSVKTAMINRSKAILVSRHSFVNQGAVY